MNSSTPSFTFPRLAWIACSLLVFISAFNLSGTHRSPLELDPSWHAVLEYAALHHWQFGPQIVFTFGPLGYLAAPTSLGHIVGVRIAFAVFWSAIVTLTAITLANRLPMWPRIALIIWLAAFPLAEGLDQTAFWVLASGTLLMLLDLPCQRWQSLLYILSFILLALIKTSFFTTGAVSLTLVIFCWIAQKKFSRCLALALAAPTGFVLGWRACGQSASNIGVWIHHGAQLESGYSAAMNLTPKTAVLAAALSGLALLVVATIAVVFRGRRIPLTWAVGFTLAQYTFLAWKEGFTRSGDWHAYVFLWYLPLGMAFFLLPELPGAPDGKARWAVNSAFAASIIFALAGSHFQIGGFASDQAINWPHRIADRTHTIVATLRGNSARLYAGALDPQGTPMSVLDHARDVIGDQSVDVMNYLQTAAVINDLNYQPRPVFQGFVAYTPALQRLNEEYFESPQRSKFVMLCQQATDNRFPSLEDSAALNFVLNNYVPVARDGSFLILRQRATQDLVLTPVREQTLHFGEKLDLRPWPSGPLFMSVEIDPSLSGRAATLLYQPAPLSLIVSHHETTERYRIVPSMATHPFLISPILDSNFDVMKLFASNPGKIVDSVTFERSPNTAWEYRDAFRVRLYTSSEFPLAARAVSGSRMLADVQDRVFWPMPAAIDSAFPARLILVHGTAAVMVGNPSKIVIDVPPHTSSFSGYYGIPAGSSGNDAKPTSISILVHDASGAVLSKLDRPIAPPSNSSNASRIFFQIPIEEGQARTVTLITNPTPGGGDIGALSFWSHCRFEETPPSR
jgi:hypothetical protein